MAQLTDVRECKWYSFVSIALCENPYCKTNGVCSKCQNAEKGSIIPFSHYYTKLDNPLGIFTTVRRRNMDYRRNQIRLVRLVDGTWKKVRIVQVSKRKLSELSTEFLMKDTDCINREASIKLLNSFYQNPIQNEELMTILILEWIA